jgi:hypothetical protein
MSEATLEGKGMASMIRQQIGNLKDYILTIHSDISQFNSHVELLLKRLNRLGQTTNDDDLLMHLFDAYSKVQDKQFVDYIRQRKSEHDDGRRPLEYPGLMGIAKNEYKRLVTAEEWQAPTDTEKDLTALKTELSSLKKKVGQKFKSNEPGQKSTSTTPQKEKLAKPEWLEKHIAPKGTNMKDPKTWNKKEWWWCSKETGGKCTGHWRIHKPKECKGREFRFSKSQEAIKESKEPKGEKKKSTNSGTKSAPKLAMALEARTILENAGIDPDAIWESNEDMECESE